METMERDAVIDLDALERRLDPHFPPIADLTIHALIAELRASRKVVEAARDQQLTGRLSSPRQWEALRAALAELEALK